MNTYLNSSMDIVPDFMPNERPQIVISSSINLVLLLILLSACTAYAPVQEMSNARQSLQAAKDANAEKLATNLLAEAEQRLNSATRELDAGEYEKARTSAVEAKHLALKARQIAVKKRAD